MDIEPMENLDALVWAGAPESARWLALDANGLGYFYTEKPEPDYAHREWIGQQLGTVAMKLNPVLCKDRWKTLIFQRPGDGG